MAQFPASLPDKTRWEYIAAVIGADYSPQDLQFVGLRLEERYGKGDTRSLTSALELTVHCVLGFIKAGNCARIDSRPTLGAPTVCLVTEHTVRQSEGCCGLLIPVT